MVVGAAITALISNLSDQKKTVRIEIDDSAFPTIDDLGFTPGLLEQIVAPWGRSDLERPFVVSERCHRIDGALTVTVQASEAVRWRPAHGVRGPNRN